MCFLLFAGLKWSILFHLLKKTTKPNMPGWITEDNNSVSVSFFDASRPNISNFEEN